MSENKRRGPNRVPASARGADAAEWPTLTPLVPEHPVLPALDLNLAIPEGAAWLRNYISACADQVQVNPGLVAPISLSVMSLAVSGAVGFVGRPGHQEPPVLWTVTLAPPSERKSTALRTVLTPWWATVKPAPLAGGDDAILQQMAARSQFLNQTPGQLLIAADTTPAGFADAVQVQHGRQPYVTRSSISQALHCTDLPRAADWTAVFDLLCEHGHLRHVDGQAGALGGRPSHGFAVNPMVLTGRSTGQAEYHFNPGNLP